MKATVQKATAHKPQKIKAYIYSDDKTITKLIDEVAPNISDKKGEQLSEDFNEETRVLEYVRHVTYYFIPKSGRAIRSSSLDELFEMYKAYRLKLPIPERQCFYTPTTKNK